MKEDHTIEKRTTAALRAGQGVEVVQAKSGQGHCVISLLVSELDDERHDERRPVFGESLAQVAVLQQSYGLPLGRPPLVPKRFKQL